MKETFKNQRLASISLLFCFILIVAIVYLFLSKPKIGYVYNSRILTEYNGVKEGKRMYDNKLQGLKNNLDTLGVELNIEIKKFKERYKGLSPREKELMQSLLKRKQEDYYNYKQSIEAQIKEDDQKLTAAVMNQINSYIIDYAKKHDYDYILGVTNDGNIFYANESSNLTDEILSGLNKNFKGE